MIDTQTYKVMHEDEEDDNVSRRDELRAHEMRAERPPADPFVLLLPATLRGYGFHNKKWSKLPPLKTFRTQ